MDSVGSVYMANFVPVNSATHVSFPSKHLETGKATHDDRERSCGGSPSRQQQTVDPLSATQGRRAPQKSNVCSPDKEQICTNSVRWILDIKYLKYVPEVSNENNDRLAILPQVAKAYPDAAFRDDQHGPRHMKLFGRR